MSLINMREAAALLGLHQVTLRTWIRQGKLASHKLGRAVRVDQSDIDRILEESYRPAGKPVAKWVDE